MMEEDRYTRITLRIPKDVHARLIAEAEAASHSLNAEIIQRVEESFAAPAEPATYAPVLKISDEAERSLIKATSAAMAETMQRHLDALIEIIERGPAPVAKRTVAPPSAKPPEVLSESSSDEDFTTHALWGAVAPSIKGVKRAEGKPTPSELKYLALSRKLIAERSKPPAKKTPKR